MEVVPRCTRTIRRCHPPIVYLHAAGVRCNTRCEQDDTSLVGTVAANFPSDVSVQHLDHGTINICQANSQAGPKTTAYYSDWPHSFAFGGAFDNEEISPLATQRLACTLCDYVKREPGGHILEYPVVYIRVILVCYCQASLWQKRRGQHVG
jgi:hypothetical protein